MRRLQGSIGIVFLILLLSGCATDAVRVECEPALRVEGERPCWVAQPPARGVVVSSLFHLRLAETRQHLFEQALVELARRIYGGEVTMQSVVKKEQTVRQGQVATKEQVDLLATINTANESLRVKATVLDEWSDRHTERLYLWVEAE